MANDNSTQHTNSSIDAVHRPFSWLHNSLRDNKHAEFAALAKTICIGVVTCLELVQKNGMAEAHGILPLLSINDSEALLMLATVSAQRLADDAEDHIDYIEKCAERKTA